MASLTMTASFLSAARPSPSANRRTVPEAKASVPATDRRLEVKKESCSRRGLVLEATAAAVTGIWAAGLVTGMAAAVEEPKPGTLEAKKKYAPVCVTMPTARICHH